MFMLDNYITPAEATRMKEKLQPKGGLEWLIGKAVPYYDKYDPVSVSYEIWTEQPKIRGKYEKLSPLRGTPLVQYARADMIDPIVDTYNESFMLDGTARMVDTLDRGFVIAMLATRFEASPWLQVAEQAVDYGFKLQAMKALSAYKAKRKLPFLVAAETVSMIPFVGSFIDAVFNLYVTAARDAIKDKAVERVHESLDERLRSGGNRRGGDNILLAEFEDLPNDDRDRHRRGQT